MLGYSLSLHQMQPPVGIFKETFVYCGCVFYAVDCFLIISDAPKGLYRVLDTTTSSLGALILTKHTSATSGEKSIIRLWLIFAEWAVAIDLPVIWPITWPRILLHAIATLGIGFGKALLRAGSYSVNFLKKMAGITKSS